MHLRRLFGVLVLGGGALAASGCGGDTALRAAPGNGTQQLLPDGGMVPPTPMPIGGGGTNGGGGTGGGTGGGGGTGAPPGW